MRMRCPKCQDFYDDGTLIRRMCGWIDDAVPLTYALSRRPPPRKICTVCAKSEALMDFQKGTLTEGMARVSIGNDHQEALRMPEGIPMGIFGIASGGFDEWMEGWEETWGEGPKKES